MLPSIEITLCRSIILDHPRWTWEQIVAAVREALQGRGDYAFLAADLLAAEWRRATPPRWITAQGSPG
jgi:hypothetical protein